MLNWVTLQMEFFRRFASGLGMLWRWQGTGIGESLGGKHRQSAQRINVSRHIRILIALVCRLFQASLRHSTGLAAGGRGIGWTVIGNCVYDVNARPRKLRWAIEGALSHLKAVAPQRHVCHPIIPFINKSPSTHPISFV